MSKFKANFTSSIEICIIKRSKLTKTFLQSAISDAFNYYDYNNLKLNNNTLNTIDKCLSNDTEKTI